MKNRIRLFGLIGNPLGHSFSAGHFADKFNREGLAGCQYLNFEIPNVDQVITVISQNPDLWGLNITIPYKQAVLPFLDEIDPVARAIGAVNTIKIIRTNETVRLLGYNTDVTGFLRSISEWEPGPEIRALVFGSGGSSLAVRYALAGLGVAFTVVSRKPQAGEISYTDLTSKQAEDHRLWINCTPVGMHPNVTGLLPLPWSVLTEHHCLYDLIYNPCITGFLSMGLRAGARTMNGRQMLIEQAEESWRIWNG
jgi:shikimate dehydrogenase